MSDKQAVNIRALLQQSALEEKLTMLGIVQPAPDSHTIQAFQSWIASGQHAGMAFLEKHLDARKDPNRLLPGVKSAVVFALPYDAPQRRKLNERPSIAKYALLGDYHKILRRALERIGGGLRKHFSEISYRAVVDTAPLFERSLAARTRLGFIGKNSCYIHPGSGSFLLLGILLLDQACDYDQGESPRPDQRSELGGCGSCRRCQVHCPTDALQNDYTVDARRCLSYWTIEHRGPIPRHFWKWLGKYWYGCDICQDVCPYNRVSGERSVAARQFQRLHLSELDLAEVATMAQEDYERLFGGTAMTRAKKFGLQRNALIALYVTQDVRLPKLLENDQLLADVKLDGGLKDTWTKIQEELTALADE